MMVLFFNHLSLIAIEPSDIVEKAENAIKGETSHGEFTMKIVRPDYSRELRLEAWNKGNDKALIEIKAPPKEAGNKTLKIENEMWTYLKATETTMKLPASMLLQSWNGSDLTNDDLVRESKMSQDYDVTIMFEENISGDICWKLELIPKPNVPVVWGKIYYWIRKNDYLPALIQYYDEKDNLIRTMQFMNYDQMNGRKIPLNWKIIDEKRKGHYTIFYYEDVSFDIKISDRKFSFRELER
jgi:outer membrane lipoprotein-sorting protein